MTIQEIDNWLQETKTHKDEEYDRAIHSSKIQAIIDELTDEE